MLEAKKMEVSQIKLIQKWILSVPCGLMMLLSFLSLSAQASILPEDDYMRAPFYKSSTEPHQITFLNTGLASLQARLDLIESAQQTLEMEYFIYQADSIGRILAQALIRKAQEGVQVRLMVDTFISGGQIDGFHVEELVKHGVEIRHYNTTPFINVLDAQYRNHRKLMVADDRIAITGGRNIKDEYYDLSDDYNFKDRDILIKGPVVKTMRESFDVYWDSGFAERLERPERPTRNDLFYMRGNRSNRHGNSSDFERDLRTWESRVAGARDFFIESDEDRALVDFVYFHSRSQMKNLPQGVCHDLTYVTDVPGIGTWAMSTPYRKASEFVYDAIDRTQSRFMMESPYFILNERSSDTIERALERDVDFSILTNSLHSTDALYVSAAFFGNVRPWVDRGLRAHIFRGDVIDDHDVPEVSKNARWGVHSKSMVFDDDHFMVGTFNFDPRSKVWNSEMAVFCRDAEMTEMLAESIQKRMDASIVLDSRDRVNEYELYQTGLLKRVGYYLLYIPSNLLDFLL